MRLLLVICTLFACGAGHAAPKSELWVFWNQSDMQSAQTVDHAPWQTFLDRYLVSTEDGRGLLRYRAVTDADRQMLSQYLDGLASMAPRSLPRPEQFAYWINLYNALTVKVVLDHPGKKTILRMGKGLFSNGPWNDALIRIEGKPITLNDIEHRILRPIWQDRRIHFAVNCASTGCPDIANEAYTPENLERLLDAGERTYLEHPRGLLLTENGTLQVSSIFDWYRADFAADQAGLLRYLASVRTDLADSLANFSGKIAYAYDWSLNSAD